MDSALPWSHPIFGGFFFLVGACIGSFLNVCIYRIPLEVSLSKQRSYCPSCGSAIPWRYNIPILSWFLLGGRTACCSVKMDARYWIVELMTAVFFYALWKIETPPFFVVYAIMISGLLVASCIDIDYFIIPDRFTLGGCLAGFIASALVPELHGQSTPWQGFIESLRGAFVGGMILWIIAKVGAFVFKKEAMGLGDVKFLAGIGAFLGPWGAIFVLASSSVVGSVFGLLIMARRQKAWGLRMPYGPFLAIAAGVWIFGGSIWMQQYLNHLKQALQFFSQR